MASKTYAIKQNGKTVLAITITEPEGVSYTEIQWDSKTGLVTAKVNGKTAREPIPYTGKGCGCIEPGPFEGENIYAIDYNYWYY